MQQELSLLVAFLAVACALLLGVGVVLAAARLSGGAMPDTRLLGRQVVGQWGRVVRTIPRAGVGMVRVAGRRVMTGLPARAHDQLAIAQGAQVVVVDVHGGVLEVVSSADDLVRSL